MIISNTLVPLFQARDRILTGIAAGKRGFADASAVGAGKTLGALAACAAVSVHLAARGHECTSENHVNCYPYKRTSTLVHLRHPKLKSVFFRL